MGCGGRKKTFEVRPEQKWDYISLKDFKSNSGFTVAAYVYVYISILISIAVYGVDSFTAVSLLVFGQWTSSIEPSQLISFDVSKWIFSICIIASFINLAFEHVRAWRVMSRGSVAESYLDTLAVRLESTRMGKGQGWRRFLVFAELTKSKKGAEYVALFTYFSFQSWIRVIFCSGPRQFVNALTLYAVFTSELIPTEGGSADKTIMNFFEKIGSLANENYQQAVVLSGMLFTLVIWVISALSLLMAALFYVFFLWHYIPRQDGGLSGYCERKINKRLMKVVSAKVNKAIAKEEQQRMKAEMKAAKRAGEKPPLRQQATLPTLPNVGLKKDDSLPEMPMLSRTETMATLPQYTSRPGTPNGFEMTSMDQKRPLPSRTNTLASQSSYSSRAPLMGGAASMGRSTSPVPTLPQVDLNNYPPVRPGTAQSNRTFGGPAPSLHRIATGNSSNFGLPQTQTPGPYSPDGLPAMPAPARSPTAGSMDGYGNRPMPRPMNQFGSRPGPQGPPGPQNRPMYDDGMGSRASPAPSAYSNRGPPMQFDDGMGGRSSPAPTAFSSRGPPMQFDDGMGGRSSPAPSVFSNRGPPTQPMFDDGMGGRSSPAPSTYSNRGPPRNGPMYNGPAYSPMRSATNPVASPNMPQFPPQRNMTAPPMPSRQDDFISRPGTASSQRTMPMPRTGPGYGYNNDVESQRGPPRW
ncbi:hypothetical protein JX265_000969 [Neoarthrinium moseri]|uniref:Pheromone-regulated membrane protein n=1 Tax=Neoarthrinium moseri TaxID=1658444 RepID=A0A9P9WXB1_9PEZI|nr:hypothetical protein JX266_007854 [Neoarthrinium moseri]KAI1880729.1 hypothetical protein JX265_000969 [Neoarthrinium moseri]